MSYNYSELLRPKYLLARIVVIRHLECLLTRSAARDIRLYRFEHNRCGSFKKYLQTSGAYFIMCHDGAFGQDMDMYPDLDTERNLEGSINQSKIVLRGIIFDLLIDGYNVALINGLSLQDTKV